MSGAGGIIIQRRARAPGAPRAHSLRRWALAARGAHEGEITLRIVGAAEIAALNDRYRHKNYSTNVLSFPFGATAPDTPILGDVVICAAVASREALAQRKPLEAHWAHLVIHGVLHLLGHDHQGSRQARTMERLERTLLASFGFANPYA